MEREFKWEQNGEGLELLKELGDNFHHKTIRMSAVYFDTPDGLLSSQKGGLRLRQENEKSICCLKLSQVAEKGLFQRQEYETPAIDIQNGLINLISLGAPKDLCRVLQQKGVQPICQIRFFRQAFTYHFPMFSMEIALDDGFFNGKVPFSELEAEFKQGDFPVFYRFCLNFQKKHHLRIQPFSKLARAMQPL